MVVIQSLAAPRAATAKEVFMPSDLLSSPDIS